MTHLQIASETFRPNLADAAELILAALANSNLRSDESQQRRTQAARDSSVGGVVVSEELREHVLLLVAKSLGESTARPCWSR
jgi:hypothetical protein